MGWFATEAADAGDLSSNTAVVSRILAMLKEAVKKMDVDVTSSQMMYALKAYTQGLSKNPQFMEHRLQNMESMLFAGTSDDSDSDSDAATKADMTSDVQVLLPLFRLAEIAYEDDTDALVEQLKEQGFELHKHDKEVKAGDVGYYIAINHTEKVMVIGIKGTSSLADALTDCVAATMPHWCDPFCPYSGGTTGREIRCHEGILAAAIKLCDDVETAIMEVALRGGYMTKIVGHSLGAGTAALLGILLRTKETNERLRDPKYMHVWAFACPPVVDLESCVESKSFITSIVNKSDAVPRCSLANLQVLTNLLGAVAKKMQEDNNGKAISYRTVQNKLDASTKAEEELPIEMLKKLVEESHAAVDITDKDHLYVPGQVVLLYDKKSGSIVEEEEVTTGACLVVGSHKYLRMIEFNSGTIADHYCDSYAKSLNDCLKPPSNV